MFCRVFFITYHISKADSLGYQSVLCEANFHIILRFPTFDRSVNDRKAQNSSFFRLTFFLIFLILPIFSYSSRYRISDYSGSRNFSQYYRSILAHIVPPFATRISRVVVDVELPGGERGNVQTVGGDRVSTISLLGCSTSVALAMGPTDEEDF
jgi:hypothetical protein